MKKSIIAMAVLLVVCLFVSVISLAVCGGELISTAVKYGVTEYREYKAENTPVSADGDMKLAPADSKEAYGVRKNSAVCPEYNDCEQNRGDCPNYGECLRENGRHKRQNGECERQRAFHCK